MSEHRKQWRRIDHIESGEFNEAQEQSEPEGNKPSVGRFLVGSFLANRDLGRRYLLKSVPVGACYSLSRNNMGIGFESVGGCGKDRRSLF